MQFIVEESDKIGQNFYRLPLIDVPIQYDVIEPIRNISGRVVGWKVVLVSKECLLSFSSSLLPATDEMTKKSNKILGFIDKKNREEQEYIIHRGHLLGSIFKKNVLVKDFNFDKDNPNNIFPQYKNANCGSSNTEGQLQFEQEIKDYLDKNSDAKIYYEVEAIFVNEHDTFPIANRLLALKVTGESDFPDFHVLVWNCQELEYRTVCSSK